MRILIVFWGALALASSQPRTHATPRVAAAKSVFTSLQFSANTSQSPDYPQTSLVTEWTTYDGTNTFPLFQRNGATYLVSGEFAPRPDNTYVADYLASASGSVVEYGDMTLSVPLIDEDHDGLPDLLQPERSVAIQVTGSMHSDYPFSLNRGWSGTLSRSAGTQVGLYSLTRIDAQNAVMNGLWQIGVSTGSITYDRSTKEIHFELVSMGTGSNETNSGSTTFTVLNANQISLPEFVLVSGSSGTRLTNLPSVFDRTGNTYVANVTLRDGSPSTFWPDYTQVHMTLVDTNDFDGNGIPDLSDISGDAPAIQSQPADVHANIGTTATFAAGVTGSAPLQFQWNFNGAPLSGQITPFLQINNVQLTNSGVYTLMVSNKFGTAFSRAALLIVNQKPTVAITSPTNQSSFNEDDLITIAADAQDVEGAVTNVSFLDGGTLIGSLSVPPFSLQRTFSPGIHTITASVTDQSNAMVESDPVTFSVLPKNHLPSVVLVSPAPDAIFLTNRAVQAQAVALDPDGQIAGVQFTLNNVIVATTFTNYLTNLTGLAAGKYTLNAIATDTRGGATTSAPVNFSVVITPTLVSLSRDGTNAVNILATGTGGIPHVLQLSFNTTNWLSIATNTGQGQISFTDLQRGNASQQFYRVIVP